MTSLSAARLAIREAAQGLAESGMSAELLREAMADMAKDATDRACSYIAQYDREEEDRRAAIDREDHEDDLSYRRDAAVGT